MHSMHEQPAFIMAIMAMQHCWIIWQHAASPDIQVMHMPSLVISHLQVPMVMFMVIIGMPFIIMQQDIMEPPIMVQRFCIIAVAISSLLQHIIFMPPSMHSMVMVQRGIIIMFIMPIPIWLGIIIGLWPIMVPIMRSMFIVFIVLFLSSGGRPIPNGIAPLFFYDFKSSRLGSEDAINISGK